MQRIPQERVNVASSPWTRCSCHAYETLDSGTQRPNASCLLVVSSIETDAFMHWSPLMSVLYDNVKHRSQGIDATLANNEHIIRTTDITAKPRSYVGEHLRLIPPAWIALQRLIEE